jgi:hypothetical protein
VIAALLFGYAEPTFYQLMTRKPAPAQLDLLDLRRQLVEMRSLHSGDPRITTAINRLISKLAHLSEPEDLRHEDRLRRSVARTIEKVETIISSRSSR